jgi:aminocarboxymuconate-semialdehyde decarboxylase
MTPLVDAHSHWYPRWYFDALATRETAPRVLRDEAGDERWIVFDGDAGLPLAPTYHSLELKAEFLRQQGFDAAMISFADPDARLDSGKSDEFAERVNHELAALERISNGHLFGLGVLPDSTPAAAAAAALDIASCPTLYGVIISSRVAGHELDDPLLTPLWQVLAETETPIFIHPQHGLGMGDLGGFGRSLEVALGYPFETAACAARLLLGGVLERFASLRILLAHGGGALMPLLGRLDAAWRVNPSLRRRLPQPPSEYASSFYLDTVVHGGAPHRNLSDLVGPDRIVLGTDHPFPIGDPTGGVSGPEERERLAKAALGLFQVPLP